MVAVALAGCRGNASGPASSKAPSISPTATPATGTPPTPSVPSSALPSGTPGAFPSLPPVAGPLRTADVLITSRATIPRSLMKQIAAIPHVTAVEPMSVGALPVQGRTLTIAAVDPARYRAFTPYQTATADDVWRRVTAGEVAVDPSTPKRVVGPGDLLALGEDAAAETVHVGAYAPLTKRLSAVVNRDVGRQLGLPARNALLVSTGQYTPRALKSRFEQVLDGRAQMTTLALEFDNAVQAAVLTGTSVPAAVGSFTYTRGPNGTIVPDSGWVARYIRTENVPILGRVTCNKAMLPQLRAALTDVVRSGLAGKIDPRQYAGCYYPRYIGRDPAKGISLHSWGIAVDLNVGGNQRGTVGEMDREVVAIFKKWGFAWGGDWNYTDPMHFEMNRVVAVG